MLCFSDSLPTVSKRTFYQSGFALLALVGLSGCSGGGASSLSGAVTVKGVPVTAGVIGFRKEGAPMAGGPIGADGSYSVTLPPGEYKVRIDAPAPLPPGWKEGQPLPNLPRLVPESYANFDTSGLTATVTGESSQKVDFALP